MCLKHPFNVIRKPPYWGELWLVLPCVIGVLMMMMVVLAAIVVVIMAIGAMVIAAIHTIYLYVNNY